MNDQERIQALKQTINNMLENWTNDKYYGRKSDYLADIHGKKWELYKLENPNWKDDEELND